MIKLIDALVSAIAKDDTVAATAALESKGFKVEIAGYIITEHPSIILDEYEKDDVEVKILTNGGHAEVQLTHKCNYEITARIVFMGASKVKVEYGQMPF